MPGSVYERVHEIASDQFGVFTVAQAKAAGVDHRALAMMVRRGTLQRLAHGLYADPLVPPHRLASYMAAALWPIDAPAVLSHETALDLLELSDINPARIHLTVPTRYRVRRTIPPQYLLHHAEVAPDEITHIDGIPVTTASRTLRDCHAAHVGPAILRQAADDAVSAGWLQPRERDALLEELFGAVAAGAERSRN